MNEKLFLVTIRHGTEIVERRFTRVDMTYTDYDDVMETMELELRDSICCDFTFDILPVAWRANINSSSRK